MDIRLQEALDFSNYRLTLNTQLNNLKIKLASDLIVTYQNGVFTSTVEKLNTFNHITSDEFPFIDDNGIPILITNLPEFYNVLRDRYQKAMNNYYIEYNKVSKSRNIKKIVDYNE
jgi:hypothetical protein